jgi:hypothetical protein
VAPPCVLAPANQVAVLGVNQEQFAVRMKFSPIASFAPPHVELFMFSARRAVIEVEVIVPEHRYDVNSLVREVMAPLTR